MTSASISCEAAKTSSSIGARSRVSTPLAAFSADGTSFLEVYVDHYSGVDFRFRDVEDGYDQVMQLKP
jgi:hypothetical protein